MDSSTFLLEATENLAQFHEINVEIPSSWSGCSYDEINMTLALPRDSIDIEVHRPDSLLVDVRMFEKVLIFVIFMLFLFQDIFAVQPETCGIEGRKVVMKMDHITNKGTCKIAEHMK